jgi:hypothetical protein
MVAHAPDGSFLRSYRSIVDDAGTSSTARRNGARSRSSRGEVARRRAIGKGAARGARSCRSDANRGKGANTKSSSLEGAPAIRSNAKCADAMAALIEIDKLFDTAPPSSLEKTARPGCSFPSGAPADCRRWSTPSAGSPNAEWKEHGAFPNRLQDFGAPSPRVEGGQSIPAPNRREAAPASRNHPRHRGTMQPRWDFVRPGIDRPASSARSSSTAADTVTGRKQAAVRSGRCGLGPRMPSGADDMQPAGRRTHG